MIRVRWSNLLDVPKFLTWLWNGREKNDLDANILTYPTLRIAVAENGKPLAFAPFQVCYVLESLAMNPELDAKEKLDSVVELVHNIEAEAFSQGIRELLYLSSDERTDESAVRQLGFEKVVAYRKRLLAKDGPAEVGQAPTVRGTVNRGKKRPS